MEEPEEIKVEHPEEAVFRLSNPDAPPDLPQVEAPDEAPAEEGPAEEAPRVEAPAPLVVSPRN